LNKEQHFVKMLNKSIRWWASIYSNSDDSHRLRKTVCRSFQAWHPVPVKDSQSLSASSFASLSPATPKEIQLSLRKTSTINLKISVKTRKKTIEKRFLT